jgi:hypothetical protein
MGQAVYALTKFGRHLEALDLVESCAAEDWWCSALMGLVYHTAGRPDEAEEPFGRFLEGAPDSVRCDVADATWLLGRFPTYRSPTKWPPAYFRAFERLDCAARLAWSDTIFWLADPLYVLEGNDRRSEYLARALQFRMYAEISEARPVAGWDRDFAALHRTLRVRRGPRDSWEYPRESLRGLALSPRWTSKKAARYHFVPDFEGEGLSNPSWRLLGEYEDEGYTPAYAPFHPVPVQIARFRAASGPTMQRMAAAVTVRGTPVETAAQSGYLVFTDAPESFPLQLESPFRDGRAVYLADSEAKPHVVSFEILTGEGIGWHREWVRPLATEGTGLSDLLLYMPTGREEPDSVLAAAALMHGTTSIEAGELGLYWEVYGVSGETPIAFELEVRKEDGGFIDRLRRLLPGGGEEEGEGRLGWTDPAAGEPHPRAVILDLRNLEAGAYSLVLRARWGDGEPVETTRRIEVR